MIVLEQGKTSYPWSSVTWNFTSPKLCVYTGYAALLQSKNGGQYLNSIASIEALSMHTWMWLMKASTSGRWDSHACAGEMPHRNSFLRLARHSAGGHNVYGISSSGLSQWYWTLHPSTLLHCHQSSPDEFHRALCPSPHVHRRRLQPSTSE